MKNCNEKGNAGSIEINHLTVFFISLHEHKYNQEMKENKLNRS